MDNIIDIRTVTERSTIRSECGTSRSENDQFCPGLLLADPADDIDPLEVAPERAAEPIKNINDIRKVCEYLIDHQRWRDHLLFVCGVNFGLRVSDLLKIRFCDLIDEDGYFKDEFKILEQKTSNTRKRKSNRRVVINDAVKNAVLLYLENMPGTRMDDYLFRCEGNRGKNSGNPLTRMSVDRILKGIAADCELPNKMSSHSLRKTFGYQVMAMSNNDPRQLLLLQKIFGHSSQMETMIYIGLTSEEIEATYKDLNLGLMDNSGRDFRSTSPVAQKIG